MSGGYGELSLHVGDSLLLRLAVADHGADDGCSAIVKDYTLQILVLKRYRYGLLFLCHQRRAVRQHQEQHQGQAHGRLNYPIVSH